MSKKTQKNLDKEIRYFEENPVKPAVLFSFDGTVMNTEPAILSTYRHLFAYFGKKEVTTDIAETLLDTPVSQVAATYFPKESVQKFRDEYLSWQNNHLNDLIQPMDGIQDILEYLRENNYTIGIISARDRSSIMELLQHHNMAHYFQVVIGNTGSSGHFENRTQAILEACRLMHAENCIYISGRAKNLLAGKDAGAFTIGFLSDTSKTVDLVEGGADFLTGDYRQVAKLFKGEPLWLAYHLNYPEYLEKLQKDAEKKADKEKKKQAKKGVKNKDKDDSQEK